MPTKYVDVNGYAIHYFHTGHTTLPDVVPDLSKGKLLIYIHGAGGNGHYGHKLLDLLAANHSPLAFDFPSHGRSSGTESLKSIPAYSDCLYALAQQLRLRPAVLVGHSMGGAIAMDFALRHADQVEALILVATAAKFTLPSDRIDIWKQVMTGRAPQPFTKDAFSPTTPMNIVQEGWMEQIKTDPRVRYFDLVACSEVDITPRLGEIRKPTLVVCGQDDVVTPVALGEQLRNGISGAKLEVVPEAGHAVPLEKPKELCELIEKFVT
jgi:pimeloyl-ACP methyl ester carboxylesterase